MNDLPGGTLKTRPLHFIWICDCSASMSLDGKMQSLNAAIRESLPHMVGVAEQNPNASVRVQTLRFSSGARWMQDEPVNLEQFRWTDLVPDDLPRTAAFAAEFRSRLAREGAQTGDVQISLIWNNFNDLDLHVVCPSNERISFSNKRSSCAGELDVDMNVLPTSQEPVENVYWPRGSAPRGHYKVFVNHYRNHGLLGCSDPTSFRVAVNVGGFVEEFTGRISFGSEPILVHQFDVDDQVIPLTGGGNTDMGEALRMLSEALRMPPMASRGLPPVLVLISDGQPTDDFAAGLQSLMQERWAQKAVRLAIAIGQDADESVLQQFIGHTELRPLHASNPDALVRYIKWASTAVLQSVSAPAGSGPAGAGLQGLKVPIPTLPPELGPDDNSNVIW
ncbi:VWA domain-containing protein [Herpetosiphon giganteus]|uniref:VWA domain-containing protein n=1 Tax=Herpetosiphon giganteus TaxID=2029754 RepID=UPI00195EC45C|nr:VWA domain-containing protein [Herpetosiphon giganteus]MBM7846531.1 uncharacterized protein YegL [Herpetosiphon giganteus]